MCGEQNCGAADPTGRMSIPSLSSAFQTIQVNDQTKEYPLLLFQIVHKEGGTLKGTKSVKYVAFGGLLGKAKQSNQ